ncbi:MAG: hypothetical protein CML43_00030, partial [Rhodobacteraceae bacterium]|nr:hypothetical protein [Paracoccaceae bacterium]
MTTFTVNTLDDELFDNGTLADEMADGGGLSLREAIGLANTGLHAAGDGPGIELDAALAGGVLLLTQGQLSLSADMSIAADLTIDAQGASRVMRITDGHAALSGLSLINGAVTGKGGGLELQSGGSAALTGVTVGDNMATGGAGGVHVALGATLTARDTAVIDNATGLYGGGLIVNGDATFLNSEIGGNSAGKWGGGVDLDGGGALSLVNVTVHGNSAVNGGAGVDAWNGALSVVSSTFTGNTAGGRGGAIYMSSASDHQSSVANSIFAGNAAASVITGHDMFLAGQDLDFAGGVILGTQARTASGAFAAPADKVTVLDDEGLTLADLFAEIDAVTGGGRVEDNGGPVRSAALALRVDNPALGGADGSVGRDAQDLDGDGTTDETMPVDARMVERGAIFDIGAHEATSDPASAMVNTLLDVVDADDGLLSLREAIALVEATGVAGGRITFAMGGTIALDGTQLEIAGDVIIEGDRDGDGTGDVTLDAGGLSRVMRVTGGADATINGVNFTDGDAFSGGGLLIDGESTLMLSRAIISDNIASSDGGGIALGAGSTLRGRDLVLKGNTAGSEGGGINVTGDATLVNAEIADNSAIFGGGIEMEDPAASLVLVNGVVHGNHAHGSGGGIDAFRGAVVVQSSTVTGNDAANLGGGLYVGDGATMTATNSIFAGNDAGVGVDAFLVEDLASGGGLILGTAAELQNGAPAPVATVAPAADLFAQIDGATGGGLAADNGGFGRTVALKLSADNPALGGAVAHPGLVADDALDLDGDGDVSERLSQDAAGAARDWNQTDVGALEAAPIDPSPLDPAALIVTTVEDVVDENDGLVSLREAVAVANAAATGGLITFDASLDSGAGAGAPRLLLAGGEIGITGDVGIDGDIDGDGIADVTLDARGLSRVMSVTSGGSAMLSGLVVTGGDASLAHGGGISVIHASLDLRDSVIHGNAGTYGGGLYANAGDLRIANTEFRGNAASYGGGMAVWDSTLAMGSVTVAQNMASGSGGGIAIFDSNVALANLTLADNTAGTRRGGAWIYETEGAITQSTITGNVASGGHGGVQVDGASGGLTLSNSILAGNLAFASEDQDLSVNGAGVATLAGGVILGAAANATGGTLNTPGTVTVLADGPRTLADVFAGIEPDGAPTLAANGGSVRTAALRLDASNPALASGDPGVLPLDVNDVDDDFDFGEPLPIAANGVAIRSGAPDLGAAAVVATPDAVDDAYALGVTGGVFSKNVMADGGLGPDLDRGLATVVSAVDGEASRVGVSFDLAEGGRVRVNADGQFWFARDGDFDDLVSGESRTVSFTYTLVNALGLSDAAQVSLTVTSPNAPPAARDDAFATTPSAVYARSVFDDNGFGADGDPDGHTITVSSFEGSAANVGERVDLADGGAVRLLADGRFWFVADGDFDGLAPGESAETSFAYAISDGFGGTDTAVATFTVTAPNAPPAARDDAFATTPSAVYARSVFDDNG